MKKTDWDFKIRGLFFMQSYKNMRSFYEESDKRYRPIFFRKT